MNLNQIRLELRGPIKLSPFAHRAGECTGEKIMYCKRQIKLFGKWYGETAQGVFRRQINQWQDRIVQIVAGKL